VITPLEQLVESLEARGEPPPGWAARYAANLTELWDECDLPGVLYRLVTPSNRFSAAGAPAMACARVAIELADLKGTPWSTFVEELRKGVELSDNLLDEAEPLFNEESQDASPRVLLAMTVVYRMLLADDYQHTDEPVRAGLGAVEAAAELERLATDGSCPRILDALRSLFICPTLETLIEAHSAANKLLN